MPSKGRCGLKYERVERSLAVELRNDLRPEELYLSNTIPYTLKDRSYNIYVNLDGCIRSTLNGFMFINHCIHHHQFSSLHQIHLYI